MVCASMETTRSAAGEVAREVNARIQEIAESLAARGEDGHRYTFFCECGCMRPVTLSLAAFAENGAFLDGHPREAEPEP